MERTPIDWDKMSKSNFYAATVFHEAVLRATAELEGLARAQGVEMATEIIDTRDRLLLLSGWMTGALLKP